MTEVDPRLGRLNDERDNLLRSLEDLDAEYQAGDVEPPDYESLRQNYIARTSVLLDEIARLGQIDARGADAHPFIVRARRRLGKRGTRRVLVASVFVWVIAGVALAALHFAGVRLPGQSATGSVSLSEALVVQQQLTQASDLAGGGQVAEAISLYAKVLATVPHQHEALTYQGWLIRISGLRAGKKDVVTRGDQEIALAASVAPGYADARGLDAIALAQDRRDIPAALIQLDALVRDHPSQALVSALRPQVVRIYQQAKIAPPAIFVVPSG